jgi:glycosyltransferase involved in cell wall biosynthesis
MNRPHTARPRRVAFVFAWLVVGGEETEVRLLAQHLDKARYTIDVIPCFRKDNMPALTHEQLGALGVHIDHTPYTRSFEDTVAYLADVLPRYDLVVACQAVPDVYPALKRLHEAGQPAPPLIEHGGLVSEALAGPKDLTACYIGVCETIRAAAAGVMGSRADRAIEIPSMVDLGAFAACDTGPGRAEARRALRQAHGWASDAPVIGWVGRLDRKKRVEDFIDAAARVVQARPDARFAVIGGPDAFMPDYADWLQERAAGHGLNDRLRFLGDRADVPRLLCGLDAFAWLSEGEGMPHVIAEAGAARLPVVATRDNGSAEQIIEGETGLFVPHRSPDAVAEKLLAVLADPAWAARLGAGLRATVEREWSTDALVPVWMDVFDRVLAEGTAHRSERAAHEVERAAHESERAAQAVRTGQEMPAVHVQAPAAVRGSGAAAL